MRTSSAGRGAWSPARCNFSCEILPAAPRPAPRPLPAPCPCPFRPPAPAIVSWSPPASFSDSACAPKTWTNPPRSIARRRCPPARGQTAAARHVAPQPESPPAPISAAIPVVFSATVFPPVFGPLITSNRSSPPSASDIGTIARFSRRNLSSSTGCRAASSRNSIAAANSGMHASKSRANRARAKTLSKFRNRLRRRLQWPGHRHAAGPSIPSGCEKSPPPHLPPTAPADCLSRPSQTVRRTPSAPCRWRRAPRPAHSFDAPTAPESQTGRSAA